MRIVLTMLAIAALVSSALGQDRKTIYVDRMEGLESYIEKALLDAELPFDFIEEEKRPELKANLKSSHSAYGEILYQHKLGRKDVHRLELVDVETGKVIARHSFQLKQADEESRRSAAAQFASKVRAAMAKQKRR